MSNIHFIVEKYILFKENDVFMFSCCFGVKMASQSEVHIFALCRVEKFSAMNSRSHKHVLFDQLL